jgi:hypothetical protein
MNLDATVVVSSSKDQSLRVWELQSGECAGTLLGHTDMVTGVGMTEDCRVVISSSRDATLRLWHLDWDLQAESETDWDEGARPILETFLVMHTGRESEALEDDAGWCRRGKPLWMPADFEGLLRQLSHLGYGWLRPDGVRAELEKMAETWQEGPVVATIAGI